MESQCPKHNVDLDVERYAPLVKLGPLIGVSRSSAYRLGKSGALRTVLRPGKRTVYIAMSDVRAHFGDEVARQLDRCAGPLLPDREAAERWKNSQIALGMLRKSRHRHEDTTCAHVSQAASGSSSDGR